MAWHPSGYSLHARRMAWHCGGHLRWATGWEQHGAHVVGTSLRLILLLPKESDHICAHRVCVYKRVGRWSCTSLHLILLLPEESDHICAHRVCVCVCVCTKGWDDGRAACAAGAACLSVEGPLGTCFTSPNSYIAVSASPLHAHNTLLLGPFAHTIHAI